MITLSSAMDLIKSCNDKVQFVVNKADSHTSAMVICFFLLRSSIS